MVSPSIRRMRLVGLVALAIPLVGSPASGGEGGRQPVVVLGPVIPLVFDGDLRTLEPPVPWRPGDPVLEVPRLTWPPLYDRGPVPGPGDPLLVRSPAGPSLLLGSFTSQSRSFAGSGFTGVNPADPNGDVGPNHYIETLNNAASSILRIYDKAVPSPALLANTTISAVWTAAGGSGECADGWGDPIVLWDSLADRWLASEFASNNQLCVLISQGANPVTSGWYLYQFTAPNFPDYPKYAVWPDAYYVTTNEGAGPTVYALDRAQMLGGAAATAQYVSGPFLAGFGFQAFTPADVDGSSPPPAGSPGIVVRHRDDEAHNPGSNNPSADYLEIWELDVDWLAPANTTFGKVADIALSEFDSDLCGLTSFYCFGKPGIPTGSWPALDPLREVVMWRLAYRNFGGDEKMVGNFVTDVTGSDEGGIRWFELAKSGGSWSLAQEGTYAGPSGPDGINRWMGSIAMDAKRNIALGYSVSSYSPATYPGIRYTGRLFTDPAGTMPRGEGVIVEAASNNSSNRWGDYSAISVDPSDDRTFWYVNMHGSSGTWAIRTASFGFDADLGLADYNGDFQEDIGVFRNGMWYLRYSPDYEGLDATVAFGSPTPGADRPEIGEFGCTGGDQRDAQRDLMVLRGATSTWTATQSPGWSAAPDLTITFGTTAHKRIATRWLDTNRDGCSDIGLFRNGCFYVLESPDYGPAFQSYCFGVGTDTPVAGDLDGDGKSDFALWRAATAHYSYRLSSEGYATDHGTDLGAGDYPIIGDLDGDGTADLGSYKESTSTFRFTYGPDLVGVDLTKTHGVAGDIPMLADMNGDKTSDIGVFRNAIARWWFFCSPTHGTTCVSQSFGVAGDIPIYGKPPGMP